MPLVRLLFLGNPHFDRRIQNFYHFFLSNGYQVEIIAGITQADQYTATREFPITAVPISHSSGPLKFLSYHRKLLSELRRLPKADVLFACDLYSLRAASITRKNSDKTRLVYDAREIYTELPTVTNRRLIKQFWKSFERSGLLNTDLVITTAPNDANALQHVYSFLPRSIVVRNMPRRISGPYQVESLRSRFTITPEKKILVYVGGLQKDRGLENTIDAVSEIKSEIALVLIGDGILRKSLEEKVITMGLGQSVFFYGSAHANDVIPLMRSADAGISLIERRSGSYKLALPSKLFEYLHAGLPVVSSPLEQVVDCVEDRESVFFADENTISEITSAIRKAIAHSSDQSNRITISNDAAALFSFEADAVKLFSVLSYPSSNR